MDGTEAVESSMEIEQTVKMESAESDSQILFKTPVKRNIIIVRSPVADS